MQKNKGYLLKQSRRKLVYEATDPEKLIIHFTDNIILDDKEIECHGKGALNNMLFHYIYKNLSDRGIETHFEKIINMREHLVRRTVPFPFYVKVRNIAAGSICTRLGLEEGRRMPKPILEFYYKNSPIKSAMVSENYILSLNWLEFYELDEIKLISYRINDFLSGILLPLDVTLVDLHLEFGRIICNYEESIVLIDEITLDNSRMWDAKTDLKLDKEAAILSDNGKTHDPIFGYREVAKRLGLVEQ